MTFEYVAFLSHCGMAGAPFGLEPKIIFDCLDIGRVNYTRGLTSLIHVLNPANTTAAGDFFVHIQHDVVQGLAEGNSAC